MTYGTFGPDEEGNRFPDLARVYSDFAAMAAHGVNAVRVYTPPPRRVLDAAADVGLWVMVGLPWEQHIAFLTDRQRPAAITARVTDDVASCVGHPAVLCYAIGNEIPASVVRWHGRSRIERFIERLCRAVRSIDEEALLTYVNFPSTEYLAVPEADIIAFNVYLDDAERLAAYVSRLHNLADDRPLLLTELGMDSLRNGAVHQAEALPAQIRTAFRGGCAGVCVFAWTDEWHRGENEVLDWDFGLTDRQGNGKPALSSVADAFGEGVPAEPGDLPTVSVVVCSHNGASTLTECLEGVLALDYPSFEVLLVDDGSTDRSACIGRELGVRAISTPNRGLSAARNTGLDATTGEIVAYLDDDAWPDRNWLTYIALTFAATDHAAVGGPNLPPTDERGLAACVGNAPGGPVHVLVSDTEAEHLPGCNMAFRRDALTAVGGFDPQFRVAGDDVDIGWRLRERGMTLGFHPAAMVWHRRRATLRRFWRQQHGYGRAEALLERKWPEKYNTPGHPTWGGRLYGRGAVGTLRHSHVYYGVWGSAAFQQEVDPGGGHLLELAAAPEWYLVIAAFLVLGLLGMLWHPLLVALAPCALAVATALAGAIRGARAAAFRGESRRPMRRLVLRAVTFGLHLLQPAARLAGRLGHGLVPWRRPQRPGFALPAPRRREVWSESWQAPEERVRSLGARLRDGGARVRVGGGCDRWDLQVCGGALGGARLRTMVEEHGGGRQLWRCRIWPRIPRTVPFAVGILGGAGTVASLQHALFPSALLVGLAMVLMTASARECGIATASALRAVSAGAGGDSRMTIEGERGS